MKWIQIEPVVQKITAAVFVPAGSGAPVHRDRSAHGLAYNVDHTTTYRFADGRVVTCYAGHCVYLPRGSSYTVDKTERSPNPDAGVYAINFQLAEPLSELPFTVQPKGQVALHTAFVRGEKAWRQKLPGFREECFSRLYAILSLLRQETDPYTRPSRTEELIAPAVSYIHENFTNQTFSLPHLASLCSVSEPYLRRLFHSTFGMAPAQYVRHRRLLYARELLRTGEYSVSEAATAAGFNDTAYFSREFKAYTGMTPSAYVKKGS